MSLGPTPSWIWPALHSMLMSWLLVVLHVGRCMHQQEAAWNMLHALRSTHHVRPSCIAQCWRRRHLRSHPRQQLLQLQREWQPQPDSVVSVMQSGQCLWLMVQHG